MDEAVALLEHHGEEARLIAGGHSLLPLMKLRLAAPEVLIDINGVTDLQRISVDGDTLRIGAMVRHAELLASAVVGEHYRMLHDAERVIADPVVRNRGTVGGSLCQADPSEDLSAAFGALRAEVVIGGSAGERVVPVRDARHRPVRDRGRARRDPHGDPASPACRGRQQLPEGGAPSRATGRSPRPARSSGSTATRSPTSASGLAAVGAAHSVVPAAEDAVRGRTADEETIALAGRLAGEECAPSDRPARAGRLQAGTRRRADPASTAHARSRAAADRRRE